MLIVVGNKKSLTCIKNLCIAYAPSSSTFRSVQVSSDKMAAKRTAKKGDWTTKIMPEKTKTVQLNVGFTNDQMEKIKCGFIPEEMEDKWFIYYVEEEESLYLHRSWTGFCVYVVKFKKIDGGCGAERAVVNDEPEQYKCSGSTEDEKRLCLSVINAMLLGVYGDVGSPLEAWSLLGQQSITPHSN